MAARYLEERKSIQKCLDAYSNKIGFGFDSRAFQRLVNEFFHRPWDGIEYKNSAVSSAPIGDKDALATVRSATPSEDETSPAAQHRVKSLTPQQSKLVVERKKRPPPTHVSPSPISLGRPLSPEHLVVAADQPQPVSGDSDNKNSPSGTVPLNLHPQPSASVTSINPIVEEVPGPPAAVSVSPISGAPDISVVLGSVQPTSSISSTPETKLALLALPPRESLFSNTGGLSSRQRREQVFKATLVDSRDELRCQCEESPLPPAAADSPLGRLFSKLADFRSCQPAVYAIRIDRQLPCLRVCITQHSGQFGRAGAASAARAPIVLKNVGVATHWATTGFGDTALLIMTTLGVKSERFLTEIINALQTNCRLPSEKSNSSLESAFHLIDVASNVLIFKDVPLPVAAPVVRVAVDARPGRQDTVIFAFLFANGQICLAGVAQNQFGMNEEPEWDEAFPLGVVDFMSPMPEAQPLLLPSPQLFVVATVEPSSVYVVLYAILQNHVIYASVLVRTISTSTSRNELLDDNEHDTSIATEVLAGSEWRTLPPPPSLEMDDCESVSDFLKRSLASAPRLADLYSLCDLSAACRDQSLFLKCFQQLVATLVTGVQSRNNQTALQNCTAFLVEDLCGDWETQVIDSRSTPDCRDVSTPIRRCSQHIKEDLPANSNSRSRINIPVRDQTRNPRKSLSRRERNKSPVFPRPMFHEGLLRMMDLSLRQLYQYFIVPALCLTESQKKVLISAADMFCNGGEGGMDVLRFEAVLNEVVKASHAEIDTNNLSAIAATLSHPKSAATRLFLSTLERVLHFGFRRLQKLHRRSAVSL
eukprot:Gregarina_sp_Poly_1__3169@NODE_189_length_11663_cov_119_423594_g168_i0_p2_GENE_NODE_189_length_11663_cov_119_423594_g168_i0NODE_189_length_11663_cov_119_423594_g168_i0_p2_ORF_typecomplete_len852_score134_13CoA_binding_2/PF13380_6/0_084_NODE_189_length_11663_cov_119_423594_g168_i01052558